MALHLVLGGARSGKSAWAEAKALAEAGESGAEPVYVATAQALDAEMAARIERHRADRDHRWRTLEAPLDLVGALDGLGAGEVVLVDCLTLWLTNSLLAEDGGHGGRVEALLGALDRRQGAAWLVSNEVGSGITPANALARLFQDEAGRLHQRLAALAETVTLVVAGLPLKLKG